MSHVKGGGADKGLRSSLGPHWRRERCRCWVRNRIGERRSAEGSEIEGGAGQPAGARSGGFSVHIRKQGRREGPCPFRQPRAALEKERSTGLILYLSFKHDCLGAVVTSGSSRSLSPSTLWMPSRKRPKIFKPFKDSVRLTIDGDGRALPRQMIDAAGLDGVAMFVGLGKS